MTKGKQSTAALNETPRWVLVIRCILAFCVIPLLQNQRMFVDIYRMITNKQQQSANNARSQPGWREADEEGNADQMYDEDSYFSGEPFKDYYENPVGTSYNFPANLSKHGDPKIALFYNVYWNPQNTSLAYDIIKEQLEQRKGKSIRFVDKDEAGNDEVVLEYDESQRNGAPNAVLYYFSLGAPNQTMPPCEPCHHLGHRTYGFEEFTLQAMYEYCLIRPQDTVVYFHNKGSFTVNKMNNRLRRHLTKAIFSRQCLHMRKFNFCTAVFSGFPFPQSCGNFYTARCSYVNRLIPPRDFARVKMKLHRSMMQNTSLSWVKDPDPVMSRDSWLGLNRYALEHWIGSHPALKPASVYPMIHGAFSYRWVPKDLSWVPWLRGTVLKSTVLMKKAPDYYKLAGRLYLYEKLYGELPHPDSWVWTFYFV